LAFAERRETGVVDVRVSGPEDGIPLSAGALRQIGADAVAEDRLVGCPSRSLT